MAVADLYVLDASALLAHLERSRGHTRMLELLDAAAAGETHLIISEINLGEVYYVIHRRLGANRAREMLLDFEQLPITPVAADWALIERAASLKADGGLSYADCFAVALAIRTEGILVARDKELRHQPDITVDWLA